VSHDGTSLKQNHQFIPLIRNALSSAVHMAVEKSFRDSEIRAQKIKSALCCTQRALDAADDAAAL